MTTIKVFVIFQKESREVGSEIFALSRNFNVVEVLLVVGLERVDSR